MKKYILLVLLTAAVLPARAETIQSVSYNPARHGQYERLNINHKINVPGGLRAVKGEGSGSLTLSSPVYEMKQMTVNGSTTLTSACLTNGSCSSGEGSVMQLKGGTVTVNGDSYIAEVVSASTVKAKTLSVPNVTVEKSITLGSGTISKPSDISNCSNWTWKGVTDASGATHKVLALAGCTAGVHNCPGDDDSRCTNSGGTWIPASCECDCGPDKEYDPSDGTCKSKDSGCQNTPSETTRTVDCSFGVIDSEGLLTIIDDSGNFYEQLPGNQKQQWNESSCAWENSGKCVAKFHIWMHIGQNTGKPLSSCTDEAELTSSGYQRGVQCTPRSNQTLSYFVSTKNWNNNTASWDKPTCEWYMCNILSADNGSTITVTGD